MGSGEYTVDANKRLAVGKLQEAASKYSTRDNRSAFSSVGERHNLPPTVKQTDNIDPSIRYFHSYGIGLPVLENASRIAVSTGRPAAEELIRSGVISRSGFALITAGHCGVDFSKMGPDPKLLTKHSRRLTGVQKQLLPAEPDSDFSDIATEYRGWQEKPRIYIACEPQAKGAIDKLISHSAISNSQIALTTRKALHNGQFVANHEIHLNNAISGLAKKHPDKSACRIITGWQAFGIMALLCGLIFALEYSPAVSILIIHIIASAFYLAVTFMRAAMIIPGAKIAGDAPEPISRSSAANRELPIYTVMVALYDEAGQVDELVGALAGIDWPADRLQILLICEADDPDTIAKCHLHCDDERFQIIVCPVSQLRTKPKALNFALPLAKGEFLVLYDAEDRPHRDQLREAHDKFLSNGDYACLQAPLFVHNDRQTWFTRMFAIEYTTQFVLILPVLEYWHSPIPLGGTSNHFRTKALQEIGAWDPYNVTEDADLGIRLARFGYRCGTIKLPTMEEAPPVLGVWFRQRTRWIKGWLQTLLVHMRHPVKLSRELGLRKTVFFHLVITTIVMSVLIHPFFIASSIYYGIMLASATNMDGMSAAILGIDAFNLVGGYSTYFAVAWLTLEAKQRRYLRSSIIWIPLYWLLISAAGWRALFQLFYKPFLWEKTRHGLSPRNQTESNKGCN